MQYEVVRLVVLVLKPADSSTAHCNICTHREMW